MTAATRPGADAGRSPAGNRRTTAAAGAPADAASVPLSAPAAPAGTGAATSAPPRIVSIDLTHLVRAALAGANDASPEGT